MNVFADELFTRISLRYPISSEYEIIRKPHAAVVFKIRTAEGVLRLIAAVDEQKEYSEEMSDAEHKMNDQIQNYEKVKGHGF